MDPYKEEVIYANLGGLRSCSAMSETDMSRMRPVVGFGIGDQKRRGRPAGVLELHAG